MKRSLLVLVFAGLLISGCANDQYNVEREYWKINKQAMDIFINPVATPEIERNRVIGLLSKFAGAHPKSMLAVRAEFTVGRIYLVSNMFDKARAQFNSIAAKYPKSTTIVTEAMFLTGGAYQAEKKSGSAVEQFRAIFGKYPLSPRGFQMPIYIAQYYASIHEPVKMQEAFRSAIDQYQNLAQKDMKSAVALRSYMLIADCYAGLKDWNQAITALETIIANFKDKAPMDGVLMNIAVIYQRELKDNASAKAVFARLVKDYPKSRYAKAAAEFMKKQ